jgi:hypothetical protein
VTKSAIARHKAHHPPLALLTRTDDPATFIAKWELETQRRTTQLFDDASAVMRAMQGWRTIARNTEAGWRQACAEAWERYQAGRFLLERLGAERFLDPPLMAILWHLRQTLVAEYAAQSPTATMLIDLAVMTYYNALRVQGWLGDLALQIEHECFDQEGPTAKLRQRWGRVEGLAVEDTLRRLAEQLVPLFERCNQQLIRTLKALRETRAPVPPPAPLPAAIQVNLAANQQVNHLHTNGRNGPGAHRP